MATDTEICPHREAREKCESSKMSDETGPRCTKDWRHFHMIIEDNLVVEIKRTP